jgi:hypothetical protein
MPSDVSGTDPSGTIYHGLWRENGCSEIAIEDPHGRRVGTVRHVPKSSPTGMNWGYAGSGPADTARSLLIDVLGEDAVCRSCAGTGRVVYVGDDTEGIPQAEPFDPQRHPWAKRGWPCECDEGYRRLPVSRFVSEYVIHWGKEWTMSRHSILDWLNSTSQPGPGPERA